MSVSVTVSGKMSRYRDPSNRSRRDPLGGGPVGEVNQGLAFARRPVRVAQGIRHVLWPIAFRRREARRAGRQTVEDLGKDGARGSERGHFEPMEEVPALHGRRTGNQPRSEDWHLKGGRI